MPKSRFSKQVLRNGLTLLHEELGHFHSVSIGMWVRVGTRHERSSEVGLSHFMEHMLFKGTHTRSATEITRAIENVGGEFNAFTTREYTCFHVSVLAKHFELGMEILSDILQNSAFDARELERERKVIMQELAVTEDNPEEYVHDLHFEKVFGRHGLGRSILGTETSVRRFSRADLLQFYRKYYQPENLIVSVAGAVDLERVQAALKPLRGKTWHDGSPRRKRSIVPGEAEVVPTLKPGLWWYVRNTEQAHIVWGVEAPAYGARAHAAALVLTAYLGGGMSSVLFQKIREEHGLAYSLYSSLHAFHDSGVLTVYVGCSKNQVHTCLRLIEEALIEISLSQFNLNEFEQIKESLKGTLKISWDSLDNVMQSNATDEIYFRRHYTLAEVCKEFDEVRPEDIRNLVRKLLKHDRRSIAVYGPKPTPGSRKRLRPIWVT